MTAESYSEKHFLKSGDILFARTGATVGKTYYYDGSIGMAVFAGYCIRFRFDTKKVLPKFVYWCTKTSSYANWVKGIQRPSGQPNINKEEYKSYEIVLPELDIQRRLVQIMDEAANKRALKLRQADEIVDNAKIEAFTSIGISFPEYTPSLFNYITLADAREYGFSCNPHSNYLNKLFEELKSNREYKGHLSNYIDVNPATKKTELEKDTEVSFVPMSAVSELINYAEYEIRKYSEVKTGFTNFKRGDLLWAKITPCMQNGKSFIAQEMPTEIGFGSTEFHVLRIKSGKEDEIYMPYLWMLLSERHILEAAQGMFSGSAGQQRVSDIFLKNFPVVLPEFEIQRKLANRVLMALNKSAALKKEAETDWQNAKEQFEKELLGE